MWLVYIFNLFKKKLIPLLGGNHAEGTFCYAPKTGFHTCFCIASVFIFIILYARTNFYSYFQNLY